MAIVKHFLRNTQTNAGTGGIGYDLSSVQGTAATLVSGTINNATYAEVLFWQLDGPLERITTTSFPTSIEITALTASPSYRWRLQRVNSSNVVQASSAYSTVHNTTGTKTETITFSTTWNAGDRLRLSLEVNREAGHSASGVTVGVNRTTGFVDVDIPSATVEETITLSSDSLLTTVGALAANLSSLNDGLMYSYSMETNASLVDDLDANNGTNTDTTLVTGRNGNGLQYNGTSSISSVPHSATLASPVDEVTLVADFYPTAAGQSGFSVIQGKDFWSNTSGQSYSIAYNASNQVRLRVANNVPNYTDILTTETLTLNQWNRIVAVYSRNTLRQVWVNGVQQTFANVDIVIHADGGAGAFRVGAAGNSTDRRCTGTIDNVMGWNRALTSDEIGYLVNDLVTWADFQAPPAIEESITLSGNSVITGVAEHIMESIVSLGSVSDLQSFANLIADQTSVISADSDTLSSIHFLLEVSISVTSDAQVQVLSNLVYDSITSLSGSSNVAVELNAILQGFIDLISNGTVTAQASVLFEETITLLKDAQVDYDALQVLETIVTITSDHELLAQAGLVTDASVDLDMIVFTEAEMVKIIEAAVSLLSQADITGQVNAIMEEVSTIIADSSITIDENILYELVISLIGDSDINVFSSKLIDGSIILASQHLDAYQVQTVINETVDIISNSLIQFEVNLVIEEVLSVLAGASITVDVNLLYELVISLLGDSDITVLASKVADESIILSSQHLDSYQVQAIVDEAVDIISNSLIEFQVYLLVEEVISVLADSGLDVDSEAVYENAVTLLTDADFQAFLDSFIDVSVEISSAHFTDAQNEAIVQGIINLTVNGLVEAQLNQIYENVTTLLSGSGITVDISTVISAVSLILSSSNITSTGNTETENSVTLTSDHDIFIDEDLVIDLAVSLISESLIDFQIEAILSNAITILADSGIEADTEMVMEALAEILSGSEIVASTGNIFTGEVDLNSSHFTEAESEAILVALVDLIQNSQIDSASIAEMENASQIGSDAQIDKTGNILMDGSVSLDFNTQIQNIGSLLIEKNIMLFTESFITSLGNVLVDESVLFDTDASTDEGYNTIFSKVVELIMNSIVQASADSESSLDITLSLNTGYTVTAQHLIAEISYLIANADLSVLGMVESADSDEIALLISTGILSEAFGEFLNESLISGEITDSYDAVVEYFAFIGLDANASDIYELFMEINGIFEAIAQASITFVEEYIPGQLPSEYEESVTVSAIAQLFVNLTGIEKTALKIIGISMFRFINKLR